jgi:hypothetical protein
MKATTSVIAPLARFTPGDDWKTLGTEDAPSLLADQ